MTCNLNVTPSGCDNFMLSLSKMSFNLRFRERVAEFSESSNQHFSSEIAIYWNQVAQLCKIGWIASEKLGVGGCVKNEDRKTL